MYIRIYEDFYGRVVTDNKKFKTYEAAAATMRSTTFPDVLDRNFDVVKLTEFAGYKQQQQLEDSDGVENA
jgi:hypothetical protein